MSGGFMQKLFGGAQQQSQGQLANVQQYSGQQQMQQPEPQQQQQQPQPQQLDPNVASVQDFLEATDSKKLQQMQQQNQSPLDMFSFMGNNGQQQVQEEGTEPPPGWDDPIYKLDQNQLQAYASKQNFLQGLDQELMQKAMGGDAQSMLQLINSIQQQAFMRNIQSGQMLMENGFTQFRGRLNSHLPKQLNEFSATQTLQGLNPAYNKPALRPILDSVRQSISQKFPNASPNEQAALVNNAMAAMVTEIGGGTQEARQGQQQRQQANQQPDYSDIFGGM